MAKEARGAAPARAAAAYGYCRVSVDLLARIARGETSHDPAAAGEVHAARAADYLIAAAAAEGGFGVLHRDRHFDTLAEVLGFESVDIG